LFFFLQNIEIFYIFSIKLLITKHIIGFFFLLISVLGIAQKQTQQLPCTIETTPVLRDKMGERSYGIQLIGKDNENDTYYLFLPYHIVYDKVSFGMTKNYYIVKYSSNLKQIAKEPFNLEKKDKNNHFETVFFLGEKLEMLYYTYKDDDNKSHLYIQQVNKSTLKSIGRPKEIAQLSYSGLKRHRTVVEYEFSEDKSKLLILYSMLNKESSMLRFKMYVYDTREMELLWKTSEMPQFKDGIFSYVKYKVGNDGQVYLLGKHYKDADTYKKRTITMAKGSRFLYITNSDYTYRVYQYSDNGELVGASNITIPNKFIRDLDFTPQRKSILCRGTYSAPGTISVNGVFVFSLDIQNQSIGELSTKKIVIPDEEHLNSSKPELKKFKRITKNNDEWNMFNYNIGEMKKTASGIKYFVVEQTIRGNVVEKSGNMLYYRPVYKSGNLEVVFLTNDNEIERIGHINKLQFVTDVTNFNSYIDFGVNGKVYFLYNSFPPAPRSSFFKWSKLEDSHLISIDVNDGTQHDYVLDKYKSKQPVLMPSSVIYLDKNTIMYALMSTNLKNYSFRKMIFK